jgi:radical SAM/Cys-rich protein
MTLAPSTQLDLLSKKASSFSRTLESILHSPLKPEQLKVFQINIGKWCNQACKHCHVDASPIRKEFMTKTTMDQCLKIIEDTSSIQTVDITGGAPEGHPLFSYLVTQSKKLGKHVIDRCNLTIFFEKDFQELPHFLKENQVEIIASLPHFAEHRTNQQRGDGVFQKSIEALKILNSLGYGKDLPLHLVYNPTGIFLSGNQNQLEREYKEKLWQDHKIIFSNLYCINNMPINRFLQSLENHNKTEVYLSTLVNAFNPSTINGLMCRNQISVGYDGRIYDCDFNQMLDLVSENVSHIEEFDLIEFEKRNIRVANHCYGCTAGSGSSCGGSVV